jgi:hypothetical protein
MNCRELERIVRDVARDGAGFPEAQEHCAQCAACAERLEDEQRLSAALADLAADAVAAPGRVERDLVAAFRELQTRPRRLRRAGRVALGLWAAAAVAAVLALVLIGTHRHPERTPRVAARKAAVPAAHPVERVVAEAARKPVAKRSRRPRRNRELTGEDEAQAHEPAVTPFFPLRYGEPLPANGEIIRVRLPRSALLPFGIPAGGPNPDRRIQADVLVGEDGLARAVRFVQ